MASVVWKYPVRIDSNPWTLTMPAGSRVLSVQMQGESPQMWVLVDTLNSVETRGFFVVGTGWDFDGKGRFVGTFQTDGGVFVFHLFEVG